MYMNKGWRVCMRGKKEKEKTQEREFDGIRDE
jgi:hypothetical protein